MNFFLSGVETIRIRFFENFAISDSNKNCRSQKNYNHNASRVSKKKIRTVVKTSARKKKWSNPGILDSPQINIVYLFSPCISFKITFFHKNRSAVGFHWNANIHIYYIASYSNFGESGTGKCPHFHGSGNTYVYFFMLHTMTIQQAGRSCYGTNNDILTAAGLPVLPYEGKLWMLTKLSRWGLAILSHTHIFVKYKKINESIARPHTQSQGKGRHLPFSLSPF